MFKKRSSLIIIFLVICYTATLWTMFSVSPRNKRRYIKMVRSIQPPEVHKHGKTERGFVQKDLWIEKEDGLFHYLVMSQGSILHLNQNPKAHTHALEEMNEITCYLQQKKYYKVVSDAKFPYQQVCVLKMQTGTYNYLTNQFFGDSVLMDVYELEGHELTSSITDGKKLLEGWCETVQFALDEKTPRLKTKDLTANIYTRGGTL